jgi:hypothetical protein
MTNNFMKEILNIYELSGNAAEVTLPGKKMQKIVGALIAVDGLLNVYETCGYPYTAVAKEIRDAIEEATRDE